MDGFFTDKKVLIIGGTGTIGKSLLKKVVQDSPTVVRILSRDEHKQFELQQEMSAYANIRYLIGDVRDRDRLERAMQDIDYVFHAAAMKHVAACEYNPFEAIQTNIIGTQNVIQAALKEGVKKTILTSTDKAIAPTNAYGASKLMAERLMASSQTQVGSSQTIFASVRFGNVMGSRGSVVPLFKWQIENNREITLTDENMSRFMMTLQQATDLTIEAMKHALGGEIFVLKMPVIRLRDLATSIMNLASTQLNIPVDTIQKKIIGIRPGEKMFEELMTDEEAHNALEIPNMFIIPNGFLHTDSYHYAQAKPVAIKSYRSDNVEPVSIEQVEQMLRDLKLNWQLPAYGGS